MNEKLSSFNVPSLRILGMSVVLRACRTIAMLALITVLSCSLVSCLSLPLTRKPPVDSDEAKGRSTKLVKPVLADEAKESSSDSGKKARDSEAPAKRKPSVVTPLVATRTDAELSSTQKKYKSAPRSPANSKTPLVRPSIAENPREGSSASGRKQSKPMRQVEPGSPLVKPKFTERPTGKAPSEARGSAGEPQQREARGDRRETGSGSDGKSPLIRPEIRDARNRRSTVQRARGNENRTASTYPSVKVHGEGSRILSRPDSTSPVPQKPIFEKPDHRKYSNEIKNKAIDLVNKGGNASLVRLCRDPVTEEWSLTIYRKGRKTFSFIIYSWDPIDEQWHESLESGERSLSMWKGHIKYSRAAKDCDVLKGHTR